VAVELGHPGFVRAVLSQTKLEPEATEKLRTLVHHKNAAELAAELEHHGIGGKIRDSVMALIDLYGTQEVLLEAEQFALNDAAKFALEELRAVAAQLPQHGVLFDVGIARRLDYYSGMIFQAYTPDFGQPLVGGGRYDGANQQTPSLPACGFALGLERIMTALGGLEAINPPQAIADSSSASKLRAKGWLVENAWTLELSQLEAYAKKRGILYLALNGELVNLQTRATQNLKVALEKL
jgi:ATP phosphoribosyltransferase regulatory subunit